MQPEYSLNPEDADICFEKMLKLMESCNEPLDLIVMPEWGDIPAAQKGRDNYHACINKYNETYLQAARDMAKRCNAITFVNCGYKSKNGWRNTTHALDRNGNTVGRYYKAHEHGIRCNFFWSDDIEEAKMLMDMGVDTLLTNDYQTIATALGI